MSLQAILDVIRSSGQAKILELEKESQTQVRGILVEAQSEAYEKEAQASATAMAPAYRERARIIHRARLEALRITGKVREGLVDAALERTHGHLAGLRTDTAYPVVLRRLVDEALDELKSSLDETGTVKLEADLRDQELLTSAMIYMNLDLSISYDLDCWGGVIAKSEDGKVMVINTIEARLERITPYLRRYLAALFEDAQFEEEEERIETEKIKAL